jgi:hypothetical protein
LNSLGEMRHACAEHEPGESLFSHWCDYGVIERIARIHGTCIRLPPFTLLCAVTVPLCHAVLSLSSCVLSHAILGSRLSHAIMQMSYRAMTGRSLKRGTLIPPKKSSCITGFFGGSL